MDPLTTLMIFSTEFICNRMAELVDKVAEQLKMEEEEDEEEVVGEGGEGGEGAAGKKKRKKKKKKGGAANGHQPGEEPSTGKGSSASVHQALFFHEAHQVHSGIEHAD